VDRPRRPCRVYLPALVKRDEVVLPMTTSSKPTIAFQRQME
jgi:siroheme synthase (precorrin-2 oxidase/ferrochelatase)